MKNEPDATTPPSSKLPKPDKRKASSNGKAGRKTQLQNLAMKNLARNSQSTRASSRSAFGNLPTNLTAPERERIRQTLLRDVQAFINNGGRITYGD